MCSYRDIAFKFIGKSLARANAACAGVRIYDAVIKQENSQVVEGLPGLSNRTQSKINR
jgi:hypothetical protein